MAVKLTRWFSIDKDGHPRRRGWYEVLYGGERAPSGATRYWDGRGWRREENGNISFFGNGNTSGERWRGLAAPAK